jgi:type II secretory pathway predicted ATPase ExeA
VPDVTPESPFAPVCSRASFLESPGVGEALRRLDDGLGAREPFLLVTGSPGTGKTALAYEAVARWGSRVTVAFLAYPALTSGEFLEEIIRRFGGEPPNGASRSKLVACVEWALGEITSRGQVAMLVVDDAHDLPVELLEELRLLVNAAQQVRRPLEVLLLGLPALEARLDQPALAALRQRISVHATIEPLSPAETRRYLHHRVTAVGGDGPSLFSRKVCREIAARTGGVPRQINALATESLRVLRAWGDQTVGSEHVQTAAASLGGFAPTGDLEDSADAGAEDATPSPRASAKSTAPESPARPVAPPAAPVAKPPVPAAAPNPAPIVAKPPPPKVAPAVPAVPAAPAEPAPKVEAAVRAPAPPAPRFAPMEEYEPPTPPPLANHDPHEWVARFVGDKGPLQLSSRVLPESNWEAEPSEAIDAESPNPAEAAPKPRGPGRARPRSRSRHRGRPRVVVTAALAVLVVAAAVLLVMRSGVLVRSHDGHTAAATNTAAAPGDAGKASSVAGPVAGLVPSSERAKSSGAAKSGSRSESSPSAVERRGEDPARRTRGPFGLDVGGYRDLESAYERRDRLQELTGFQGWVVPAPSGSDRPYRIVLGAYRSRERATGAANMLLRSRTLSDVTVVPLPPRSERQ